jgi:hypothetical protein
MSAYNVNVFHINVNSGDSCVIVISQNDGSQKKSCKSAVMIDGGGISTKSDMWHTRLKKVFGIINGTFTNFYLSAIVVTHFDMDHVQGVTDLLANFNTVYDKFKSGKSLIEDEKLLLKLLKGTRIYTIGFYEYKTSRQQHFPSLESIYAKFNAVIRTVSAIEGGKYIVLQNNNEQIYGPFIKPTMTYDSTNPNAKKSSFRHIGREILWNNNSTVDDIPFTASLISELFTKNNVPRDAPGLFCLASTGGVITSKTSQFKIIPNSEKNNPTDPNSLSIILVLIDATGNILEYFGGDAQEQYEQEVVKWLRTSTGSKPLNVAVSKLSHHGSAFSTPTGLINCLYPKNFVISAGYKHSHPSIEVLEYLAYRGSSKMSGTLKFTTPDPPYSISKILTCNYPYYLLDSEYIVNTSEVQTRTDELAASLLAKDSYIDDNIDKTPSLAIANNIVSSKLKPSDIMDRLRDFVDTLSKGGPNKTDKLIDEDDHSKKYIPYVNLDFKSLTSTQNITSTYGFVVNGPKSGVKRTAASMITTQEVDLTGSDYLPPPAKTRKGLRSDNPLNNGSGNPIDNGSERLIFTTTPELQKLGSSPTCVLFAPSPKTSTPSNSIKLTLIDRGKNLLFYNFIYYLPEQQLTLDCLPPSVAGSWSCTQANVVGSLWVWLQNIGFEQMKFDITGTFDNTGLTVDTIRVSNVRFRAGNTLIQCSGSLAYATNDQMLYYNWITDDISGPNDPILILTPVQGQVNIISAFLDITNNSAMSGIGSIIGGRTMANIDILKSSLIFNPLQFLSVDLILGLDITSQPVTLAGLQLDQPMIVLERHHHLIESTKMTTGYGSSMHVEFGNSGSSGAIIFNSNFQFQLRLELTSGDGDPLKDFIDKIVPGTNGSYASKMGNLKLKNTTFSVELIIDITNLSIISTLLFVEIDVMQPDITIDAWLSFPGPIMGGKILVNTNIPKPDQLVSGLPDKILGYAGLDLSFEANFDSGVKTISIRLDDSIKPVTFFSDIYISEVQVIHTEYTDEPSESSISAMLHIGSALNVNDTISISLLANYINNQWILSGQIALLNITHLIALVPSSLRDYVAKDFPTITILNASIYLNMHSDNEEIYLTANLILGNISFSLDYTRTTTEGETVNLISIELSNSGDKVNLGRALTDLGIDIAGLPLFISNLELPFDELTMEYNIVTSALTVYCSSSNGGVSVLLSRYYDLNRKVQYLVRLSITHFAGFPVIGTSVNPLQGIYLVYVGPNKITKTQYQDIHISDDPDIKAYNMIYNYIDLEMESGFYCCINIDNKDVKWLSNVSTSSQSPDKQKLYNLSINVSDIKWITINKSVGPLFVNKIGYYMDDNVLSLLLDTTIDIGPLSAKLDGLGVTFKLNPFSLQPDFSLNGIGLDYSNGELNIAGTFTQASMLPDKFTEFYQGALTITLEPYTITAVGAYGRTKDDKVSFFVFGRLDSAEPLGGTPIAFINGIAAGFGLNQSLQIPSITNVIDFPLVAGQSPGVTLGSSTDVLSALDALTDPAKGNPATNLPWVNMPVDGGKWIALGLDLTSYEIVQTRALLTINFGNDDLEIAFLARSMFTLPIDVSIDDAFVYAELDLEAVIKPDQGFMGIDAIITSNSFVLDKDCHLTGGFSAYTWFGDNPHSGDFVVTLGGYHPKFTPPAWYPTVPRLGFNWQYSDHISITGDAYFAITPSCGMGGGGLQFLFQDDDVRAWYTAHTDVLVRWHPFYFNADIGVSIGASLHLDFLFFSCDVTVELCADLNVWGPPIGGVVSAKFGPLGFTVRFGPDDPGSNQALTWEEFSKLLPQKNSVVQMAKIICEKGLVKPAGNSTVNQASDVWLIRPGRFQFRVETTVPITQINISLPSQPPAPVLNIRPMNLTGCKSVYTITTSSPDSTFDLVEVPTSETNKPPTGIITRRLPTAMWGTEEDEQNNSSPKLMWSGVCLKTKFTTGDVLPPMKLKLFWRDLTTYPSGPIQSLITFAQPNTTINIPISSYDQPEVKSIDDQSRIIFTPNGNMTSSELSGDIISPNSQNMRLQLLNELSNITEIRLPYVSGSPANKEESGKIGVNMGIFKNDNPVTLSKNATRYIRSNVKIHR